MDVTDPIVRLEATMKIKEQFAALDKEVDQKSIDEADVNAKLARLDEA